MTEENKIKSYEEKIKEITINTIDELAYVIKKTSKKIFNVYVERSEEFFSEVFDKYLNKTKNKIKRKGDTNG
jgi:hypothetical protein